MVKKSMRSQTPFRNSFYIKMLKIIESENLHADNSVTPFGVLCRLWQDGAFDEYSDDHFMIRAFNEDVEYFKRFFKDHYINVTATSVQYGTVDGFSANFVINIEKSFRALVWGFGYDNIRRFVKNQLSAGKKQYDEELFFEALSEIHILAFLRMNGEMSPTADEPFKYDEKGWIIRKTEAVPIISSEYEPQLNGKKNPEARFHYKDGTILDVEIKTPKFSDMVDGNMPFLMPGVLLDSEGRSKLMETCKNVGIQCLLPKVLKIKDFLNSAAEKFQEPESTKHVNLLCINWTGAAVDKNDITEPLIILSNLTNGVLSNKSIAEKCHISSEAINKISAIMLYKLDLGTLLFSDFRYVFSTYKAKVVLNRFSKNLNVDTIHRITKLSCIYPEKSLISSSIFANEVCYRKFKNEISLLERLVKEHTL